MTAAIRWDPDPNLFCIDQFCIKWYGLCWALALLSGYWHGLHFFSREKKDQTLLVKLVQYLFFGGFLGARLGEFLFYQPSTILTDPIQLLYFRNGGMSSHGGFLGVIVATALFTRRHKEFSFVWTLDKMAIVSACVVVLMRLGNAMNSELPGIPTQASWGFLFPQYESNPIARHPVVLYEAAAYALLWGVYLYLYEKGIGKKEGLLSIIFLTTLVPVRLLLEFFKEGEQSGWFQLNHTQWLSVPLIAGGLLWLWVWIKKVQRGIS